LPDAGDHQKDKKSKKEKEKEKPVGEDVVPAAQPENEGKKKKKDKKDKKGQVQEVQVSGAQTTGEMTNPDGDVEMSAPVDEPKVAKKSKKEKRQKLKDPITTEPPATASTESNDHSQKPKDMEDVVTSAKALAEKPTKSKKTKKASAKEGGSTVPAGAEGVDGHSMDVDRPDPEPPAMAGEEKAQQTEDVASTAAAEKYTDDAPVEKPKKAKKNKKGNAKVGGSEVPTGPAEANGHFMEVDRPDADPPAPATAVAESSENNKKQKQTDDVVTGAATDDASVEKPKKSKKNKKETRKDEVPASAAEVNGGSVDVDRPDPSTLAADASIAVSGKDKKDKKSKKERDEKDKSERKDKKSKKTSSLPAQ